MGIEMDTESLMTRLTLAEAAALGGDAVGGVAEDEDVACSEVGSVLWVVLGTGSEAVRELEAGRVLMTVVVEGSRRASRQIT